MRYYMRVLHRNLGYLVLALAIVYSLSGILLIYRGTDFMKREVRIEKRVAPGLSPQELGRMLKIKNFRTTGENNLRIDFPEGTYDKTTGAVSYTVHEVIRPFNKLIELHKISSANGVHWFALLFGIAIFLLAVTSLFMFKRGTPVFRRSAWYVAGGVVLAVLLLLFL